MADQTQEAIDARYEVNKALKGLIYSPRYNYLTEKVRQSLIAALEAVEGSEVTPTEEPIESGIDVGHLMKMRAAGAFDVPCRTCGNPGHCKSDMVCPPDVPNNAYVFALRAHVRGLPPEPIGCAAAGHCGHAPCCNCSGTLPASEIAADVLARWGSSAALATCSRCRRDVPRRFLARLTEKAGGGLACSPLDPENQAECQRIVDAREGGGE